MIHRAKFQNFKALRDVEVTFDSRLTVLVGPNGSGKTSVLQGVDAGLLLGASLPLDEAIAERPHVNAIKYNRNSPVRIELDFTDIGQVTRRLSVEAPPNQPGNVHGLTAGDLRITLRDARPNGWAEAEPSHGTAPPIVKSGALVQFDPDLLALPTCPVGGRPIITPKGHGLASALVNLRLSAPDVFDQIERQLRSLVENVVGLRFHRFEGDRQEKEPVQPDTPQITQLRSTKHIMESIVFDFVGAEGVFASDVSSGTLVVLGLLTAIHMFSQYGVLLCDDIDHGLHPKAQTKLIGVIRELLAQYPSLQIIATSHSPYILNQLEPEEVRLTASREDGTTVCTTLAKHPQFERWKDVMTPGEFWTHVGEDWVKQLPEYQAAP